MALRNLRKDFGVAIGAGESAVRINTDETDDCLRTIADVCRQYGWEMRVWDHATGVNWFVNPPPQGVPAAKKSGGGLESLSSQGPPTALKALHDLLNEMPRLDPVDTNEVIPVLLVLKNFHLCFDHERGRVSSVIQHLVGDLVGDHPAYDVKTSPYRQVMEVHGVSKDDSTGKFVVGLMPQEEKLPTELRPLFLTLEHELPDEEELQTILAGCVPEGRMLPDTAKKVCRHALGLTRMQAEGVFSACLVQHGNKDDFDTLAPKFVWQHKSRLLNDEGLVSLYGGAETFDDVVGLEGLKTLLKDLLAADEYDPENPDLRSKGLALVGPPRCGKSLITKAAGNTLGLPTLMVDIGAWFGGIVGESESRTRKGFQIIRAHAPVIAVLDEAEKVMPSARGGDHDSGVGRRMAGTFMVQLQDIQEPVFWVFCANSIEDLHEAFLADDRVDSVVYVHLPGPAQRAACWKMYVQKFFPREVKGRPFNRHLSVDFDEVLGLLRATKKVNPAEWADRLMAPVLCLHGEARSNAIARLQDEDRNVCMTLCGMLIDDAVWTPARIKSCCRLARKRRATLASVARMMPRGQKNLERAVAKLERWAADEAVDAETGLAYDPEASAVLTSVPVKKISTVRRTVRNLGTKHGDDGGEGQEG